MVSWLGGSYIYLSNHQLCGKLLWRRFHALPPIASSQHSAASFVHYLFLQHKFSAAAELLFMLTLIFVLWHVCFICCFSFLLDFMCHSLAGDKDFTIRLHCVLIRLLPYSACFLIFICLSQDCLNCSRNSCSSHFNTLHNF